MYDKRSCPTEVLTDRSITGDRSNYFTHCSQQIVAVHCGQLLKVAPPFQGPWAPYALGGVSFLLFVEDRRFCCC